MTKLTKFINVIVLSFLILYLQPLLASKHYSTINNQATSKLANEHKLKAYHDSGKYNRDFNNVILTVNTYINQRIKQNIQSNHPQKLALVLDIDETSLSNYDYIQQQHFIFNAEKNRQKTLKGDMPAFKSTLKLFQEARKNGIAVFFVTGRPKELCPVTAKNLKNVGYNNWHGLFCRKNNKEKSAIPFKSSIRQSIVQKGYTIIANIGDQYSDLKGGFSEKTFKLPNPFYHLP